MKIGLFPKLFKRQDKHSPKRDDKGKSARACAFELFDKGTKASLVAPEMGISLKTALRYYEDWKELPANYKELRAIFHTLLKSDREQVIGVIATATDMPDHEVVERLEKPWGFEHLSRMSRKREKRLKAEESDRLLSALDLIVVWDEMGIPPRMRREIEPKVIEAFIQEWRRQSQKEKDSEDSCSEIDLSTDNQDLSTITTNPTGSDQQSRPSTF